MSSQPQSQSKLWDKAVADYITQLDPGDANTVKSKASDPGRFIQAVKASRKFQKNDHVPRSLEKISSALMLVSSVVPGYTSVAWVSIELLYNRSQNMDIIRTTLEKVIIELGDSLPRLLSYEISAPYNDLNQSILKYYSGVLELFLEINRYINDSLKKRYKFGGPPDPSDIFELIKGLRKSKAEIESEAIAVSMRQHHQLMDQVHMFMDKVVPEPKAKLPCHVLTYPENQGFRGRHQTLVRMMNALDPAPDKLKSYALYGLGGVGKTQLALKFAYSHLDSFKAIFWISAQTSSKITQGFIEAAQQLGLLDLSAVIDEDKAVKSFMSWLISSRDDWLMVFDNVDDINVLAPYWPSTKKGSILVTTRDPAIRRHTWEGERVDSMDSDDAKDMFFRAIEQHVPRNTENERLADHILKDFGYLPLAISAAAGIIVQTECDLSDFASLCDENKHDPQLFAHLNPDVTSFDYEHTLTTVWSMALQNIDARSTKLLHILTYLDPDAVPEVLLRKGANGCKDIDYLTVTSTWLQVSRELMKHSLCSKAQIYGDASSRLASAEKAATGIATHRLVLQTVFYRCSDLEKRNALAQAVAMLKSEFPAVSDSEFRLSSRWKECHMFLPQVEAVVKRCCANDLQLPSDFVSVLCACGRYLLERRSFKDAERFFNIAREVYEAHKLQDWDQTQFVQRSLGGILLESSAFRCEEAVQIFRDVVAHYEATSDPDDHVLGISYSDLAQALTAQGNYDEAIILCEKAVEIVSKIKDDTSRRDKMFHVHHNMARVYEMKGLPDEALRLHFYQGDAQGNGLRQEQSVYGAWNLYAIGNCLQLQKDRRAVEIHTKALKIRQDLLGDHYYTAISYHKLGSIYLEGGAVTDANKAFQEAHKILSDPLGGTEAELARTLWYWGLTKKHLSQEDEALKLKKKAIDIRNGLLNQQRAIEDVWINEEFDKLVVYYNR